MDGRAERLELLLTARMRALLARCGMSPHRAAALMELSPSTVIRWLEPRYDRPVTLADLDRLCDVLGVSPIQLLQPVMGAEAEALLRQLQTGMVRGKRSVGSRILVAQGVVVERPVGRGLYEYELRSV